MTFCCCGNELEESLTKITMSPCNCKQPGPGRAQILRRRDPKHMPAGQPEQRKRLGLPVLTDFEKYAMGAVPKWH